MMKRYVKKPEIVEGVQWTGENQYEIEEFVGPLLIPWVDGNCSSGYIGIRTLHGVTEGTIGDYVVKESDNNFYICDQNSFEDGYYEVTDVSKQGEISVIHAGNMKEEGDQNDYD